MISGLMLRGVADVSDLELGHESVFDGSLPQSELVADAAGRISALAVRLSRRCNWPLSALSCFRCACIRSIVLGVLGIGGLSAAA